MAQSHVAQRALAARQDEDIRARCSGFFPLTPALSLGERVNPSHRGEQSRLAGFPPRHLMPGFPLPEGEGQGEGELRELLSRISGIPGTVNRSEIISVD